MKKKKIKMVIFIDALGWKIYQRHGFFIDKEVQDKKKLRTILGYSSGCDPSIISGQLPQIHKLWSSYYYSPEDSPFKWAKPCNIIPNIILNRSKIRHYLSKLTKKMLGYTGYFQLYNVPINKLKYFDYAEKQSYWTDTGIHLRIPTIFSKLSKNNRPYHVFNEHHSDKEKIDHAIHDIKEKPIEFLYTTLGKLDGLMHVEGTQNQNVTTLLEWYQKKIYTLIRTAASSYKEVDWYVISDHGMHDIKEGVNLIKDIDKLGFKFGRDYVAFYDSTMARFWFMNQYTKKTIKDYLGGHQKGRVLSESKLKREGIYFNDNQYGELIFLMNPQTLIVPSYMGEKKILGMHGYDPDDADSDALILSNQKIPANITDIHHIYELMDR